MTWRDELLPASFRGVGFYLESVETSFGRRVEIIRFPGREDTTTQDLGADAREFSVQAFVIGPDYHEARDELERALLTPGSGSLVLPTRGEYLVHVTERPKASESLKQGGMATFAISFIVATPRPPTFVTVATSQALRTLCDELIDENAGMFAETFDTTGLPASAIASQLDLATRMSAALAAASTTVSQIVANVAAVQQVASRLAAQTETLLATPETLANALGEAFESLFMDAADLITDGASIASRDFDASTIGLRKKIVATTKAALTQLHGITFAADLDDSTPTAERETTNLRTLSAMWRMQSLGAFVRAVPDLPWTSYQEAIAARDFVVDVVAAMAGDLDTNDYELVRDILVSVTQFLESVALTLPLLREHVTHAETTAMNVAYELYGDVLREGEIVARNDVPNPASIPAGTTLEVASA